jgi:entericidin B
MFKKIVASFALISIFAIFAGCNTIEGAGEDIESGGEAIQNKSREVRE